MCCGPGLGTQQQGQSLRSLDLSGNRLLSGSLAGMAALPGLLFVNLSTTIVAGPLPADLTQLTVLDASLSRLTGQACSEHMSAVVRAHAY